MRECVMAKLVVLFGVFLQYWTSVQADTHSLYYIYTALSKPVDLPGIYDFTAMGLLDDRQIDYYNSEEQKKIPKQDWMKEKMQSDYWVKGTQSRKSKEQWFNVNVNILMERMKHNQSDLHVLQWRHGCEIEKEGNTMIFSKGIDEYSYDGENFLSFDDKSAQWVAPVDAALPTKRKWDGVPILNQYTKGYLEKECVEWLNKFREYGETALKRVENQPDVHVFARKSNGNNLKLTCLATGFYPKDVKMYIRKYRTSVPENEIESSGVIPNHDGTYQLRKSVEIMMSEKADYDCYVSHRTLKDPIIVIWEGDCSNCNEGAAMAIGIGIGALIVAVLAAVGFFLYRRKKQTFSSPNIPATQEVLLPQVSTPNIPATQEVLLPQGQTAIDMENNTGNGGDHVVLLKQETTDNCSERTNSSGTISESQEADSGKGSLNGSPDSSTGNVNKTG